MEENMSGQILIIIGDIIIDPSKLNREIHPITNLDIIFNYSLYS